MKWFQNRQDWGLSLMSLRCEFDLCNLGIDCRESYEGGREVIFNFKIRNISSVSSSRYTERIVVFFCLTAVPLLNEEKDCFPLQLPSTKINALDFCVAQFVKNTREEEREEFESYLCNNVDVSSRRSPCVALPLLMCRYIIPINQTLGYLIISAHWIMTGPDRQWTIWISLSLWQLKKIIRHAFSHFACLHNCNFYWDI
jgi:hypothetical protein